MSSKSKPVKVRSATRNRTAYLPGRRVAPEAWEQIVQAPDESDDEIDCQRIVRGDDGRSLPLYYDDYN